MRCPLHKLLPSILLCIVFFLIPFEKNSLVIGQVQSEPVDTSRDLKICKDLRIKTNLSSVKLGGLVEFEIVGEKDAKPGQFYFWKTSAGTIISGQNSTKIVVMAPDVVAHRVENPPTDANGYIAQIWHSGTRYFGKIEVIAQSVDRQPCQTEAKSVSIGIFSEPVNLPANVDDLIITPDSPFVFDVKTTASDPENDVLTYNYTATGGKMIGTGPDIKWDLSGVESGSYKITVGVDDGCGICGRTKAVKVTLGSCNSNDVPCSRPLISPVENKDLP